jgi:hypothetical protein
MYVEGYFGRYEKQSAKKQEKIKQNITKQWVFIDASTSNIATEDTSPQHLYKVSPQMCTQGKSGGEIVNTEQ